MSPLRYIPDLPPNKTVVVGDMVLDCDRGILSLGEKSVRVGTGNFRQFWLIFAKYPNRTIHEDRLRFIVWQNAERSNDIVKVYIYRCRRQMKTLGSRCRIKNHHYGTYEFVVPHENRGAE
jgi:DNA-binding response OmpR family regulator